jgi:multicomponent Na+:H+ antiporter subunit E
MRYITLPIFLFAFWLALSGHYKPFLITLGAISAIGCAYAAIRIKIVDREGQPLELLRGAITYWPWLLKEMVLSAWSVSKLALSPRMAISPTMTQVRASQRTGAGLATYANSITLTPGTVTVGISGNTLIVHALIKENALDLEAGRMDGRVTQFENAK